MLLRLSSLAFFLTACLAPLLAQEWRRDDLAGRIQVAALDNQMLSDFAQEHHLSTTEVLVANWGIDLWTPQTREKVTLPTAHLLPAGKRDGIVINRAEYRLYAFKDGRLVHTASVGVGHDGNETPLGETTVVRKKKNPVWRPTARARADIPELPAVMPPGPNNPLGAHALYLGWPAYLIHGTNDSYGIGRRLSRGCVRLFPEDIETLFQGTSIGTAVTIVDQPVKLGWHEDELFLEAYPDTEQLEELRVNLSFKSKPADEAEAFVRAAAGERGMDIDWGVVRAALARRNGLPTQITRPFSHPIDIMQSDLAS